MLREEFGHKRET